MHTQSKTVRTSNTLHFQRLRDQSKGYTRANAMCDAIQFAIRAFTGDWIFGDAKIHNKLERMRYSGKAYVFADGSSVYSDLESTLWAHL